MNRVAMESGEKESRGGRLNHRTMRTCRRFPPPVCHPRVSLEEKFLEKVRIVKHADV